MSVSHWDVYEPVVDLESLESLESLDALDGLDAFELLDDAPVDLDDAEWCLACGSPGPLSRRAGAPLCLDCLGHGTVVADWDGWDDVGGG